MVPLGNFPLFRCEIIYNIWNLWFLQIVVLGLFHALKVAILVHLSMIEFVYFRISYISCPTPSSRFVPPETEEETSFRSIRFRKCLNVRYAHSGRTGHWRQRYTHPTTPKVQAQPESVRSGVWPQSRRPFRGPCPGVTPDPLYASPALCDSPYWTGSHHCHPQSPGGGSLCQWAEDSGNHLFKPGVYP